MLLPIMIFAYSINDIIIAYETGKYTDAVKIGEDIIDKIGKDIVTEDEVNLRTYIAFSYVALGDLKKAQLNFEYILNLNPNYDLKEEFVSPKIIEVFKSAQDKVRLLISESPDYYFFKQDRFNSRFSKSNLIIKSFIIPGWGQMDRGENSKAFTIGTVFFVSVAAGISSYFLMNEAADNYQNASNTEDATLLYNRYNNYSKLNRVLFDFSISTYIFNILDILWTR
ncbi:hypothetical protein KAU15_01960 [candidate division WOR-3 bacterium]|nr:hypothetical protein [candidate division WOR-3 bacterium]